ncbi:MAG TPA: phage major capsid protein, partial [Bacteroidales bacterium]|nr:phage major capsid protein [Bacteroidales bacterium]
NKGELLAENPESDTSEQGVTFSSKTLKAYTFSSKYVLVSQQLLQDSVINVEEVLRDLLAERLGRILADYFTTGTGSSQPGGIVYQATDSGVTPATAAITRANILDLMFSVNSSYRNNGAFMFNDSTLKTIMKLTFASGDDRPLWQPNIIGSAPDRLEGRPYFINDVMDGVAAGKDSMIFGDLSKFIVRSVRETQLFVFREKFMAKLQIGFLAWNRWDSVLLDAGTHPIKKLHHHLT